MSANFVGVTFAQQKVSPSDDAIIRANMLTDGVLQGCELSYSGSTLTMAPGQLLVAGRQIRHPAAQNWAVVDATSGYARLVLTIDLTRTATKDSFDQVVDTIEYALAPDGFTALELGAINDAGTRYQMVVCVVSLGVGGISGIVSQVAESTPIGSLSTLSHLGNDTVSVETDHPRNWVELGNGFAGTTSLCTVNQPSKYGTIISMIVNNFNVHQIFVGTDADLAYRVGSTANGWIFNWRSVLAKTGGEMTGAVKLKGIHLTEGVDYGDAFPEDAEIGRIFWIPEVMEDV